MDQGEIFHVFVLPGSRLTLVWTIRRILDPAQFRRAKATALWYCGDGQPEGEARLRKAMRAMLLERIGLSLQPTDRDDPMPGDGEVRLRIEACAVCRTDL